MPYNNSNKITEKEFYTGVSRFLNVTPKTARRYWENGFLEFIIRELFFMGTVCIPHMGTISLKYMPEGVNNQKDKDGKEVIFKVPERDVPYFTPHDTFINDVNMHGVTKKYRKRLKNGQLTQRDYERERRAETLGSFGTMTPERLEASKENFKDLLNKKKAEKEGKEGKS